MPHPTALESGFGDARIRTNNNIPPFSKERPQVSSSPADQLHDCSPEQTTHDHRPPTSRRQSQHSDIAKSLLMSKVASDAFHKRSVSGDHNDKLSAAPISGSPPTYFGAHDGLHPLSHLSATSAPQAHGKLGSQGVGHALSDTPLPSTVNSPKIAARSNSGGSTPRVRPTTLDVPGLTKSKVSPDGKIAQRDVGAKLVVIMVGLPARGKSYITKKTARYMSWLQHDTRIFNVGERRREAAGTTSRRNSATDNCNENSVLDFRATTSASGRAARYLNDVLRDDGVVVNVSSPVDAPPLMLPGSAFHEESPDEIAVKMATAQLEAKFPHLECPSSPGDLTVPVLDQSANFFDPTNRTAALIREQCALDTLDELLDFILHKGGSVGILDATNSTLDRRMSVMKHIRERAGAEINILFVESVCRDEHLLESNMRLKLSGPDYKDKDPVVALADFKKRVAMYEKKYVPLGDYEESNDMPYVKLIDVGRKVVAHQIKGFLSAQVVSYLLNFNLTPRCIWVSRHGESLDNVTGKIGGDADLSQNGHRYAKALASFIEHQRKEWEVHQEDKAAHTHFPPHPGDHTPPNPHYQPRLGEHLGKSCCVWTSMLKRSVHSSDYFDEDIYDVKQMRMLDELNSGFMEGMTYEEIRTKHANEYELRKKDKLQYRYPGPGGEGYLDVINRLRPVIVELERMTDHCLLLTHRSVARVLLAYFLGLSRDDVASIAAPLGMLYRLEPKPYGVEFKVWSYNPDKDTFDYLPNFKLQRESALGA